MNYSLEFYISGNKIKINVDSINPTAKEEVESVLSQRNLDIKDLLRAYIQKSQDFAELEEKLEKILYRLEQV